MSIKLMSAVWEIQLSDSDKLVLLALADNANDDGICWPSIATLARKCSKDQRTVQRVIQRLVDAGHISKIERPGTSNLWTVTPRHGATPVTVPSPHDATPPPPMVPPKPSRTIKTKRANALLGASAFHRLPVDWVPGALPPKVCETVAYWPDGMVAIELEKFRAWAANAADKDGKGRKLDWDQAWHNWLRTNAKDNFNGRRQQPVPQTDRFELYRQTCIAAEAELGDVEDDTGTGFPLSVQLSDQRH